MMQLIAKANAAATVLQRHQRNRIARRSHQLPAEAQVAEDRSMSPTTIAASLVRGAPDALVAPATPATPAKPQYHSDYPTVSSPPPVAHTPASFAASTPPPPGHAQPPPPTSPPPAATLMAAYNSGATPTTAGSVAPPPAVAALPSMPLYTPATGLSIQAPPQAGHPMNSPSNSPAPGLQSAPASLGPGAPPPSGAFASPSFASPPDNSMHGHGASAANPAPPQPGLSRAYSMDDSVLAAPWTSMQSRTQSRLPSVEHPPQPLHAHSTGSLPGATTTLPSTSSPLSATTQNGLMTTHIAANNALLMGMGGHHSLSGGLMPNHNLTSMGGQQMGGQQMSQQMNQQMGQQMSVGLGANAAATSLHNGLTNGLMAQSGGLPTNLATPHGSQQMATGLGGLHAQQGLSQQGMGQQGMSQQGMGQGMGGAPQYRPQPQIQLTPEQHRARVMSHLVMERLCVWGEYRTVADWPQELVAHGAMPSVAEALQASPTHSLTIPQLVTAVKERTGNAHGGKALDMLNLKAYVRCYPALFHLRSGRTAAGRPLDVVELRIECAHDGSLSLPGGTAGMPHGVYSMAPAAASLTSQMGSRYGQQQLSAARGQMGGHMGSLSAPPLPPQPPPPTGISSLGMSHGMSALERMSQPADSWAQYQNATSANAAYPVSQLQSGRAPTGYPTPAGAPAAAPLPSFVQAGNNGVDAGSANGASPVPSPSANSSALQPKELFAPNGACNGSEADASSPRSLWSSPGLAAPGAHAPGFTLFGAFGSSVANTASVTSSVSSPVASPTDRMPSSDFSEQPNKFQLTPMDNSTELAGMHTYTEGDDGTHGALEADDDDDESASRMLGQIDALFDGAGRDDEHDSSAARAAYVKEHALDKLFATAVDRAMRHQVASPVEFIATELLRAVGKLPEEPTA